MMQSRMEKGFQLVLDTNKEGDDYPRISKAMAQGDGHVSIDITVDELLKMRKCEGRICRNKERGPCILRVPEFLKEQTTESYYVPQLIGLGPYHHHQSNPNFDLRSHKLKALDNVLCRSLAHQGLEATPESMTDLLQQLRGFVISLEPEIKAYYPGDFDFVADDFILDAVFLLQLCMCFTRQNSSDGLYPLFDDRTLQTSVGLAVWRDLFKLENQIPLFLLQELSNWKGLFQNGTTETLTCFYASLIYGLLPIKVEVNILSMLLKHDPQTRHLLEGVYRCIVKSMRSEDAYDEDKAAQDRQSSRFWKLRSSKRKTAESWEPAELFWNMPTAKELRKGGVIMSASYNNNNQLCLKEGWFGLRAYLHLPQLHLHDNSEMMLRNVMAFEEFCKKHCPDKGERFFNSYMAFLACLIQTDTDAAVLIKAGVIRNGLKNEKAVVNLFHSLGTFRAGYVEDVNMQIVRKTMEFYNRSTRVRLHRLFEAFFSKPLLILAALGGFILLGSTLVEKVYRLTSVKHGP